MNKIAFVFPGQGAQKAGMGKDFYENSRIAKDIFDKASEELNLDMKALCFEENDLLDLTEYTQAALVTVCLAMTRTLEEKGIRPDVTAGLSLGEYCAIAAAGGMDDLDAIRTVRIRGQLMQEAVPVGVGAMAAVLGMTGDAVAEGIKEIDDVFVANYNCPGQIVITGKKEAVDQAAAVLKEKGARRVLPLNVSGPFHSPYLSEAGEKLRTELEKVNLSDPSVPYVTNVTAEYVEKKEEITDLLARQVSSSVRWQQSVENMIENGVDTFVEIGPGRTLSGFIRKINRNVKVYNIGTMEEMEKTLKEWEGEA